MNKGFYLYCIRAKGNSEFSEQGIDEEQIFTIPYQDLEGVVSKVSFKKFSSAEIQRRAKEDLKWIKEKALIHEKVIEQAMRPLKKERKMLAIIPMKFGTIFKTKENLQESLKKYYSKFKKSLEKLAGKQEWGVKLYLNRKLFEKEIKKVSGVVQEKEKEIAQFPEGIAYFLQKEIDDVVSKEADKTLKDYLEVFFENLKKYANIGIKGKILEKELTGKQFPMILNGVFLISEEKLEDFLKEIDRLNKEYKPKGFNFEYSGPWPPYNFI